MEVKDLQPRQGKVDITLEVTEKGDVREFSKFGTAGRVCNATAKDASGNIQLTLWNEQIDQVNVGSKVKITNGYVGEFQGEKQLTTGKFGQLEVLEGGEAPKEEPAAEQKEVLPEDSPEYKGELSEEPKTEEEFIN
tara:strand:+ start:504 stop:911 length:408 start_codon:yes stop_codon:yes gene_type:complete